MSKYVATCILVVTFFTAVITPVFGHEQQQQRILPNFFYTNDEIPLVGYRAHIGRSTVCLWIWV